VSDEKNEQVQQANLFERETLLFYFFNNYPNSFKHFPRLSISLVQKNDAVCGQVVPPQQHTLDHEQFFAPNMYIDGLVKHLSP